MKSKRNTSRRFTRIADRAAKWGITIGGMAIIGTVVLMILLILNVSIPLFKSPHAQEIATYSAPASDPLVVSIDDYREVIYAIHAPHTLVFVDGQSGDMMEEQTIATPESHPEASLVSAQFSGNHVYTLVWDTGHVTSLFVKLAPAFDEQGERRITYRVMNRGTFPPTETGVTLRAHAITDDESAVVAIQDSPSTVTVLRSSRSENLLGEVTEEKTSFTITSELPGDITDLVMDEQRRNLYIAKDTGYLSWWDIRGNEGKLVDTVHVNNADTPITALNLLFGDVSIVVGTEDGQVLSYFATQNDEGLRTDLKLIHKLLDVEHAITRILPSRRDKSLLVQDASGAVHSVHNTSERYLTKLEQESPITHYAISSKGDTIVLLDEAGQLAVWDYHKPHPEASLGTLFGKVWYEKYDGPEFVWQSSAPSDDYEPKLSLTPLIFGSFKGTLYAMVFAVPLALLGALYTNQFLSPEIRAIVKPLVEIMASIPSVVIGFLVALWLAPLIEEYLVAFIISFFVIPLTMAPFLLIGQYIDGTRVYRRIERGYEFVIAIPIVMLGGYFSYLLGPVIENWLFAVDGATTGSLQQWLYDSAGTRYDQRNAIIIAFGLGFVSIPIIFTISEDALSNLPESLRAASLALGASRWQTAWRVVLPSASPGIFAACIIGFGRVIGETMIVLMATGNTPIMDWSPFNGMRTLSANIAVEIPEAPVDGTLYRVLFLSAALLFLLTFTLNTAAEIIRQRLRKKYGRFQ